MRLTPTTYAPHPVSLAKALAQSASHQGSLAGEKINSATQPSAPMEKFIIEIQDKSISNEIALDCVTRVIANGRVSTVGKRKQHCFLTTRGDIRIACVLNRKSERFVLWRELGDVRRDPVLARHS